MYDQGQGVIEDDIEAVRWYRLAAEQGLDAAQYQLGVMYTEGRGILKDEAAAVRWYRRAAEQNYDTAPYALGSCIPSGGASSRIPCSHTCGSTLPVPMGMRWLGNSGTPWNGT